MKKIILSFVLCFSLFWTVNAQLKVPAASPLSKVEQRVGLTDITITYSRPSMKDRVIFGDLVSYGETWRTGANKNTTISFSTDVVFDGEKVKAGTYALYSVPARNEWKVYLYKSTDNWGVPEEWESSLIAAEANVESVKLPISMETMLLNVGNITNNKASLQLIWESTLVSIDIEVPAKQMVEKSITRLFDGPSYADYYRIAGFYLDEKMKLNKASEYINKAIEMGYDKFWVHRRKALILAEAKRYRSAIAAAEKSKEMALAAGNSDYVKMNNASIRAWKALLK